MRPGSLASVHGTEVERCTDDTATRVQDRLIDVEDIEVGGTIDEVRHSRCRRSAVEVGGVGSRYCGIVDGCQPRELRWCHRTRDDDKTDVVQFLDGIGRELGTGSDDVEPGIHISCARVYAVDGVEKNSLRSRKGRESSGWEHVDEAIAEVSGPWWWAHFEFTRINIEPTILRKKSRICARRAQGNTFRWRSGDEDAARGWEAVGSARPAPARVA